MTVTTDRAPSLDILEGLAQELDPSEERIGLGRDRYRDLGDWLKQYAGRTARRDVEVYPRVRLTWVLLTKIRFHTSSTSTS